MPVTIAGLPLYIVLNTDTREGHLYRPAGSLLLPRREAHCARSPRLRIRLCVLSPRLDLWRQSLDMEPIWMILREQDMARRLVQVRLS